MSRIVLSNSNLRIDMHIDVDGGHGPHRRAIK